MFTSPTSIGRVDCFAVVRDWPAIGKACEYSSYRTIGNGFSCGLVLLQLDFDVYAGRQVELHQRVDCLVSWVNDVHQALMRANLELIA